MSKRDVVFAVMTEGSRYTSRELPGCHEVGAVSRDGKHLISIEPRENGVRITGEDLTLSPIASNCVLATTRENGLSWNAPTEPHEPTTWRDAAVRYYEAIQLLVSANSIAERNRQAERISKIDWRLPS